MHHSTVSTLRNIQAYAGDVAGTTTDDL